MRVALMGMLVLGLIATGCGSPTPEEKLRLRAQEAFKTLDDGKWLEFYRFTSSRFRAICEPSDYRAQMTTAMTVMRAFLGIDERAQILWQVRDVKTSGEEGWVFSDLLHNGVPLEFGKASDEGDRWVWLDGEWWYEEENWQDGCQK